MYFSSQSNKFTGGGEVTCEEISSPPRVWGFFLGYIRTIFCSALGKYRNEDKLVK